MIDHYLLLPLLPTWTGIQSATRPLYKLPSRKKVIPWDPPHSCVPSPPTVTYLATQIILLYRSTFGHHASGTDINDMKSALEKFMLSDENEFDNEGTESLASDRRSRPTSMGAVPSGRPIKHQQSDAIGSSEVSPLSSAVWEYTSSGRRLR